MTDSRHDYPEPESPRYHGGQRYDLGWVEPHTRRDGTKPLLTVWYTRCAECGEILTMRTPLRGKRFEPSRRCNANKKPGARA